ncbi:MAG TPA: hypothetical protein PKY71_06990 [Smithellaceae bacterium]|nr:hypothetical protein [Smithellaceae bacterium]
MNKIKILHITAHLGGGVGTVLSKVSLGRKKNQSTIEDIFICLEAPEKQMKISSIVD